MSLVQIFLISLRTVIGAMEIVILVRVLCEFKAVKRDSKPFIFLFSISEPILVPVRRILTKQAKEKKMRFDLSPFVAMIILYALSSLLNRYI